MVSFFVYIIWLIISVSQTTQAGNSDNTIEVKGVVPGTWELTVYDINSGYDLDLSDPTYDLTAKIGSIYIFSNEITNVGGFLMVESVNSGRMINRSTGPGIAAENILYYFAISQNFLEIKNGLSIDFTNSSLSIDTANSITNNYNTLVVPGTMIFNPADPDLDLFDEGIYDIFVVIPGFERPESSGVYTDTIVFTIMDDG